MENVKNINELIIPKNTVLLKVVEKKSKIISPTTGTTSDPLFSHYEIILVNGVTSIDVEVGDIVVAASGIGNDGGFVIDDVTYIITSGFNIKGAVKPENFKF